MAEVLFIYKGEKIIIQSNNLEEKLKDIINKLKIKMKEEESNNLYYIYNGEKVNEDLKLNQIIKDKNEKINILVYNNESKENEKEIILNEIICPTCKKNILINIKNYKINLYDCKNGHKIENILLNEYENLQKIDFSKIIYNK